jgi:hypothetical protein
MYLKETCTFIHTDLISVIIRKHRHLGPWGEAMAMHAWGEAMGGIRTFCFQSIRFKIVETKD